MAQLYTEPRVFVVDDEYSIAWSLGVILRRQGFDTSSFTNPLEALQAARIGAPNVLISDVMMSELSGIELGIRVRECCRECKVLLFSGQAVPTDLLETARADGHNFEVLEKPVNPTDLLKTIRDLTVACAPGLHAD